MSFQTPANYVEIPVAPEVLLGRLRSSLLMLRGSVAERNWPEEAQIVDILRKVLLLESVADTYLVSVAGSQGAGKTTLVREIYDLPFEALEGNLGQGERMPVIVKESRRVNSQDYVQWVTVLGADGQPERQEVPPDEWSRAVRGLSERVLVVGLDVPATFFGTEGSGFLLLPGYELEDPQNEVWQSRMRAALASSSACIVVTDETRLASSDQKQVIEDLKEFYLESVSPVVAITKTEMMVDAEIQENLIEAALNQFGDMVERNDMVLTGTGADYRETWLPALRSRLTTGLNPRSDFRRMQLRNLRQAVVSELMEVLAEVKGKADLESGTDDDYAEFLSMFDISADKVRADFKRELDQILRIQMVAAEKDLQGFLERNQGPGFDLYVAGQYLLGKSDSRKQKWDSDVLDIWNRSEVSSSQCANHLGAVSDRLVSRSLGVTAEGEDNQSALALTSSDSPDSSLVQLIPEHVGAGLAFIAGRPQVEEPPKDFASAIRLLPGVAVEGLRLNLAMREHSWPFRGEDQLGGQVGDVGSWLTEVGANRRLILGGLVAVLGIDFVADGQIDSIPALAGGLSHFFVGSTEATGLASVLSTGLAIGLVAAPIALAVISSVNRQASNRRQRGHLLLSSSRDQTYKLAMDQFDFYMEALRDRLAARLQEYLQIDHKIDKQLALKRAIAMCEVSRAELLTSVGVNLDLA